MFNQVDIGFRGNATDLGVLLPIQDICLGCFVKGRIQQDSFDDVLNFFHFGYRGQPEFMGQGEDAKRQFFGFPFRKLSGGFSGFGDGVCNVF